MTVTTSDNKAFFTGDGVTTLFTFDFALQEASDLTVYVNGALQMSGYTVYINPNGVGGTITFTFAPASSAAGEMLRAVPLTQETSLPVEQSLPAKTLEAMSDKLTMIAQQLLEQISRCLQLPITTVGNGVLPDVVSMAAPVWSGTAWIMQTAAEFFTAGIPSAGLGNVIGPAGPVTNGAYAVYNGTSGQLIGVGSTPSVNWNQIAKSAGFTANDPSLSYYRITAAGALAVTLPATPNDGSIRKFKRISGTGTITHTTTGGDVIKYPGQADSNTLVVNSDGIFNMIATATGYDVE